MASRLILSIVSKNPSFQSLPRRSILFFLARLPHRPLTPIFKKVGSSSIRFLSGPLFSCSTSHAAQTNRPCRNLASGEAAHTAKLPGKLTKGKGFKLAYAKHLPRARSSKSQAGERRNRRRTQNDVPLSHGIESSVQPVALAASVKMAPGWKLTICIFSDGVSWAISCSVSWPACLVRAYVRYSSPKATNSWIEAVETWTRFCDR